MFLRSITTGQFFSLAWSNSSLLGLKAIGASTISSIGMSLSVSPTAMLFSKLALFLATNYLMAIGFSAPRIAILLPVNLPFLTS
jgi:hypothetical protein